MGDILYGIKKVILSELDPTTGLIKAVSPIICTIDTAEEADLDPETSKGEEKVLRTDDQILAIARTEDLLYGYNLKLKDNTFDVSVASLIEGGTIRRDGGNNIIGYDSPKLADGVTMKPFQAEIYVANYEGDSIVNYTKITLTNCKGKAPKLGFKKTFFAPEFEIKARENTLANKPIKTVDYVETLPSDDITPPVVTKTSGSSVTKPAVVIAKSNELGYLYLVPATAIITTVSALAELVNTGYGSTVQVTLVDTDTSISTTNIATGSYKIYAVDLAGNISTGVAVTVA